MGVADEGTLERLKALQRELFYPKIAEHRGHIVKTSSGILPVEFRRPHRSRPRLKTPPSATDFAISRNWRRISGLTMA